MQHMQESGDHTFDVRLQSLEQRLDTLEQVGKEGLPAIRLAGVEFRLERVENGLRDLKDDVKGSTNRLSTLLGLYTGIIALAVILSQLLIP